MAKKGHSTFNRGSSWAKLLLGCHCARFIDEYIPLHLSLQHVFPRCSLACNWPCWMKLLTLRAAFTATFEVAFPSCSTAYKVAQAWEWWGRWKALYRDIHPTIAPAPCWAAAGAGRELVLGRAAARARTMAQQVQQGHLPVELERRQLPSRSANSELPSWGTSPQKQALSSASTMLSGHYCAGPQDKKSWMPC